MLLFILKSFFLFFRALMTNQSTLAAEKLALRHQLTVYQRSVKRPHLQRQDRCFWVVLSQLFKDWRLTLIIVKPETVILSFAKTYQSYVTYQCNVGVGVTSNVP
ncbi:MAG: hypothetical protein H0T92_08085 [Pyrinomonadaceae bacterium]|nr:hypothetical protein [Pyrinomonadaceae bacterium]